MELLFTEAMKIMPAGQVMVLVLLYFVMRLIKELRDEFRKMNGSVKELKQWAKQHEDYDRERFEDIKRRLEGNGEFYRAT